MPSSVLTVPLPALVVIALIRPGGVILKVAGQNYLISEEAPPWLGPTGVENFSKLGTLDWLKLTPNSEIFYSKAFIKQEFVEIKKRICNEIKI